MVVAINPRQDRHALAQSAPRRAAPPAARATSRLLENGDVFVGWGSEPYFSEYSAGGQLLFDARMRGPYQSFRAYRFTWTGDAGEAAGVAARAAARQPLTVYASWNGDTARRAGACSPGPRRAARARRHRRPLGFETAIATPGPGPTWPCRRSTPSAPCSAPRARSPADSSAY